MNLYDRAAEMLAVPRDVVKNRYYALAYSAEPMYPFDTALALFFGMSEPIVGGKE
jgi:hypothetical protein